MSAAGRPDATPAPAEMALELREAGLVRLVAAADGDALAATGLLGRALADADVPFHASVCRLPETGSAESVCTIGLGHDVGDRSLAGRCASRAAFAVAREFGADPDPVLALAGAAAGGCAPGDGEAGALEAARERGLVERRPGVAVPTTDLADGLAHSTLVHAAFSADTAAANAAIDALEADGDVDGTRLASLVALRAVEDAPPRAAEAVERALRPLAIEGPFATVGGHADVLEAAARERPGTAVALALGHGGRTAALDAWREHAAGAHDAVREADTARHHGVVVARVDGPVQTVARLLRDFRSPEPVAVAVGDGRAAVATTKRDAAALASEAAAAAGGRGGGRATAGYAEIDDGDAFVDAVREAL